MPTFGNMIDEVSAELHGWGQSQDRITFLTAGIGATDLTFTLRPPPGDPKINRRGRQ